MAFELSDAVHIMIDKHVDAILEAYKNGTISLWQAESSLAYIITAAAVDSEAEFKSYIELSPADIFQNA